MKKVTSILTALLACGVIVQAAQDTEITTREVRNPNELKAWLEANASDAESRLTSGSSTSSILPLINFNDAGTCAVTMQADKSDDAGDKTAIIGSDGAGIQFQTDITSKGTLATKATLSTIGGLTLADGLTVTDASGAAVLTGTAKSGAYDATLILDADAGEKDADTWIIESEAADNDLSFVNHATERMKLGAAGGLTIPQTLAVTGNSTMGGTLAVTGVATFTAESVHNGGIDADYITVDAAAGIDVKSAGKLVVGAAVATSLDLGASDIDTAVLGPLNVLQGTTKGIDTSGAGALYLGEAVATSVIIGASDAPTTIAGGLTMAYVAKATNYTLTASDYTIACTPGAAFVTNTLPDANTVLGKMYNIVLLNDGSGDMRVKTDGTDTIADAKKVILFEDGGDGCVVQAVGANIWALISNTGGTLE